MIGRPVFTELGNLRKQTALLLGAQGGHLGGATLEWGLGGCIKSCIKEVYREKGQPGCAGDLMVQNDMVLL